MSDESTEWDGASPWLFLLGLLVFLGSAILFVVDFARGVDILRSVAANTVGVVILITWAAHDTLRDPNSEVATVGGAAGTALLLYALYLLAAGIVIAVTGLFHDRLVLGLLYLAFAFAAATVGFVIFPRGAVLDGEDGAASGDDADTDDEAENADTDSASADSASADADEYGGTGPDGESEQPASGDGTDGERDDVASEPANTADDSSS